MKYPNKSLSQWTLSIIFASIFWGNCVNFVNAVYKLQERYAWNQLDFAFPNAQLKAEALANGDYVPQNSLPVGVEHWGNRLFITIPRWRDGIPATLTYINMDHSVSGSPELIPYPDWRFNTAGDCKNSITTAYRIKADECGRLWVLDTGTVGIGNTTTNPCPYAVNVFDLHTNTRIRRYELRSEDTNSNTFVANIAVDIGKDCDDTFAYFSDELGYGLIVYSWEKNKSWRFSGHSFFYPDPLRGDYNVAGLNFQWGEEGIFGMSLSPIKSDGYRTMYFSPLASYRQFAVSTRILRDETKVENSYHDFIALNERGPNSHTTSHVMSDDGIELYNLIDQNAIGCWHFSTPYAPQFHAIVDRDDVGLVFPADVKIDENNNVWVLSDRMPVFLLSNLDYNDINFRIYTAPLSTLIEDTICDQRNAIFNTISKSTNYKNIQSDSSRVYWPPAILPFPQSYNYDFSTSMAPKTYSSPLLKNQNGLHIKSSGPHLFPPIAVPTTSSGLKSYATDRYQRWWTSVKLHHQ